MGKYQYLFHGSQVQIIPGDGLLSSKTLPLGVYTVEYSPEQHAFYLSRSGMDFKATDKIYGDINNIVDHITKAYSFSKANLGVLLSGAKGLGKSLTIRRICEQLSDKFPIVLVNKYLPNISTEILEKLDNTVIIFDEFEKHFRGSTSEHDAFYPGRNRATNAISKQESILSLLDGLSLNHNLYLFTVNNINELDNNLLGRPGRIKYHYKFYGLTKEAIIEYCKEHLLEEHHLDINNIVIFSYKISNFSYDMLSNIVLEMNIYNKTFAEVIKYLNISDGNKSNFEAVITVIYSNNATTEKKIDTKQLILDLTTSKTIRIFTKKYEIAFTADDLSYDHDNGYFIVNLEAVKINIFPPKSNVASESKPYSLEIKSIYLKPILSNISNLDSRRRFFDSFVEDDDDELL